MKRTTSTLLATALLGVSLLAAAPIEASSSTITIIGPNGPVASDVAPYLVNGKTLVPINVIGKLGIKGLNTLWDNDQKIVTIIGGTDKITLKLNEAFAMKGTEKLTLDVPATIKNGRVMVPLRFIGESIGEQVIWNGGEHTVTIGVAKNSQAPAPTSIVTNDSPLTKQRAAALKLPIIKLKDQLQGSGISYSVVYFPVGKADAYFEETEILLSYYEIQDGKAVQIWSAAAANGAIAATNKGLPFFPYKIDKEVGKRPVLEDGPFVYFRTDPMVGGRSNGLIDANGNVQAAHDGSSNKAFIVDVPEESQYITN